MPALTAEVKDANSPVARWLRSTFPHHGQVQAEYRQAAGVAQVLPSPAVALGTQGAAIDWWLRFLVDPAPSVGLAAAGLRSGRAPCIRAGGELLGELGVIDYRTRQLASVESARFAHRDDEW